MSSTTGVDKDDSKPDDELMCDNDSEQVNTDSKSCMNDELRSSWHCAGYH